MSVLYEMLLDFLSPQEAFTAQTGSIFALYLLYFTQPTAFKKVAIRLTIPAWQNLELLYQIAFDHDATDLIYVIHKLRDKGAFMYTAQNEKLSRELRDANTDLHHRGERTLIRMEKKINASPLVPVKPLLMDLPHIATLYREAKADLVALSLARRSSEMVMEHLSSLRPTDLDMRGVTPLPPFVKDRTVSAHPSGTSPVGQLYSDSAQGIAGSLADKTVAAIHHPLSHRPLSVFEREQQQKQEGALPAETVDYPMDTERDSTYTPRASRPEGDYSALGAISSKRGKKKRSLLPYVFPFSMLQASRADFLVPIENITRNYLRDRMVRLEFTTSGGLPRNDYQFPESSLMQGRNKPLELMPESEGPEVNGKRRKSERERRRRDQQKQEHQRLKASQDRTRTREPQTPEHEERESGINSAETGMREMIQEIPASFAGQEFQEHIAASAGEVGDILTQSQQPREEQDHRSTRDIAKDISPT
ncbi:hypothetical protein BGZ98_007107 [Dissophora globulifera]|nr:hypothetical protein BGZ98_007107 [Dissophora globulifera]